MLLSTFFRIKWQKAIQPALLTSGSPDGVLGLDGSADPLEDPADHIPVLGLPGILSERHHVEVVGKPGLDGLAVGEGNPQRLAWLDADRKGRSRRLLELGHAVHGLKRAHEKHFVLEDEIAEVELSAENKPPEIVAPLGNRAGAHVLEEKMRTARKGGKRTAERLFKLLRTLARGPPDGDLVREHDGKTGLMDLLGHFALSDGKNERPGHGATSRD